jgi:hypothetical protein
LFSSPGLCTPSLRGFYPYYLRVPYTPCWLDILRYGRRDWVCVHPWLLPLCGTFILRRYMRRVPSAVCYGRFWFHKLV